MSASTAASGSASSAPPEFVAAVNSLKEAQSEMAALVQKQATTQAQENEINMVKAELDALKEGEHVYKLHGKILVRQSLADAKAVVDGRLRFITGDLDKTESNIQAAQEKLNAARKRIIELQTAYASSAAK